ncbi:branched-chain amino acid ABC transporter permease [Nocardioides sp. YIM 152315]|uniref:branched-chain amino acid ABC transporter permease n=1 Tax=Nocardioides sp. YIM 152315 TaxID=3031760 RepID=UPI0023DC7B10|nr:branched-chain amino acid ABC transporter permease [Nocardioides sp. YIM 152315]MDF1602138.1 branched-chain amino acid ABC transporter permease [Nocardioides sp. YIM 152315]
MTTTVSAPPTGSAPQPEVAPARRRRVRAGTIGLVAWLLGMVLVPWLGISDLWMGVGIFAIIAAVGALGIQVIMGFTGQISLGHSAFMAIGAYSSAWLGVEQEQPFWVWLPAAALVAGLAGALFAPIAVRIRGLYLAVGTIALVFIGAYVWETWTTVSGGAGGRLAAPVEINGQDLLDGYWSGGTQVMTLFQAWWYFAFAVLLVVMVLTWNIRRSRLGRSMLAVRDRDLAAGVVGIPVTQTKTVAFAISSAFAGVSGALLTAYMGYFTPGQWSLMLSIDFIAMVVIGGLGTITGAVLGAFFFRAVPEVVNWLSAYLPGISQDAKVDGGVTAPLLSQFVYGLLIVVILIFEPRGLNQLCRKPFRWIQQRREGAR